MAGAHLQGRGGGGGGDRRATWRGRTCRRGGDGGRVREDSGEKYHPTSVFFSDCPPPSPLSHREGLLGNAHAQPRADTPPSLFTGLHPLTEKGSWAIRMQTSLSSSLSRWPSTSSAHTTCTAIDLGERGRGGGGGGREEAEGSQHNCHA